MPIIHDGHTAEALSAISRAIGRGHDPEFLDMLDAEKAFAEQYRRRAAMFDDDVPGQDEFANLFATLLSVLSASHLDAPVESTSPLAIQIALAGEDIDLNRRDLDDEQVQSQERVREAINTRCAVMLVLGASFGTESTEEEIRARRDAHAALAQVRLVTTPRAPSASRWTDDEVADAVSGTQMLAVSTAEGTHPTYVKKLSERGAILAIQDLKDPFNGIAKNSGKMAHLHGMSRTGMAEAMRNAIRSVKAGSYGGMPTAWELPLAAMTGREDDAWQMAADLATCAITLLRVGGGVLHPVDPSAEEIAHVAADVILQHLGSRPPPKTEEHARQDLFNETCVIVREVGRELDNVSQGQLKDPTHMQDMIELVIESDVEEIDRIMTSGEIVRMPDKDAIVLMSHVFIACASMSPTEIQHVRTTLEMLPAGSEQITAPAGMLWCSPEMIATTWRNITGLAKLLAASADARYAALPLVVEGRMLMLTHDGSKATLLNVAAETDDHAEAGRGPGVSIH